MYATDGANHDFVAYARRKVSGPAIGLIITCLATIAYTLSGLVLNAWFLFRETTGEMTTPVDLEIIGWYFGEMVGGGLVLVMNVVILLGAIQMKRARNRGLAIAACILNLIPWIILCVPYGAPFGIWGLVVLKDPLVKDGFQNSGIRDDYDRVREKLAGPANGLIVISLLSLAILMPTFGVSALASSKRKGRRDTVDRGGFQRDSNHRGHNMELPDAGRKCRHHPRCIADEKSE